MSEENKINESSMEVPLIPLDQVLSIYGREVTTGPVSILFELIEKEHFPAAIAVLPAIKASLRSAAERFLDLARANDVVVSEPAVAPASIEGFQSLVCNLNATIQELVFLIRDLQRPAVTSEEQTPVAMGDSTQQ